MLNKNACLLPAVTQATDNVRQRLDHSVTLQRGVLGERGWGGERGGGGGKVWRGACEGDD